MIQPNVERHARTTRICCPRLEAFGTRWNPDVGIALLDTEGLAVAYLNGLETDRAQEGYIKYILNDS